MADKAVLISSHVHNKVVITLLIRVIILMYEPNSLIEGSLGH